jgi:uncharacterized phiE125 gp8 family phage protein
MRSKVVTPPDAEPVTLDEAKRHARIFIDADADENLFIASLIVAAREKLESKLSRAFVSRTMEATLSAFPTADCGLIRLPKPPLLSVESITYIDADGVNTIDPSAYAVDEGTPGTVQSAPGSGWPILPAAFPSAVKIRYTAGYGAPADVPAVAKLCIKMLVAHWYDRREPIAAGSFADIPYTVDSLLDSLRWGGESFPR